MHRPTLTIPFRLFSLTPIKTFARFGSTRSGLLNYLLVSLLISFPCCINTIAQTMPLKESSSPHLSWTKDVGVNRYRIQIANDPEFKDVLFDGRITGNEYEVRDLPPGHYYWRVAPAELVTGQFQLPAVLEIKRWTAKAQPAGAAAASGTAIPGWLAATGEIAKPLAVTLRTGLGIDFIGVNAKGTVYALSGSDGVALWTSQFQSAPETHPAGRAFIPLVLSPRGETPQIIVAFEKGVRALDGKTGRELWRTELSGKIVMGVTSRPPRTVDSRIFLIDEKLDHLTVLNCNHGKIEAQYKLKDQAVATPAYVTTTDLDFLVIPLRGGLVELRNSKGDYIHSIGLGAEITTGPIVVETRLGSQLYMGTKKGLIVIEGANFQSIRLIPIGDQYPVGSLSAADFECSNQSSIVMITSRGRVMAVDTVSGEIKWSSEGTGEATAVALADLNSDGRPDVVIPGKDYFALGLSGVNGAVIWQSPETDLSDAGTRGSAPPRSLVIGRTKDGRLLVVGTDPDSVGLQAQEITGVTARANAW